MKTVLFCVWLGTILRYGRPAKDGIGTYNLSDPLEKILSVENVPRDPNAINVNDESAGVSPDSIYYGTLDMGLYQINTAWVDQEEGKMTHQGDPVYDDIQREIRTLLPDWDKLSDTQRREYLLDPDISRRVAKIILEKRGIGQWSGIRQ